MRMCVGGEGGVAQLQQSLCVCAPACVRARVRVFAHISLSVSLSLSPSLSLSLSLPPSLPLCVRVRAGTSRRASRSTFRARATRSSTHRACAFSRARSDRCCRRRAWMRVRPDECLYGGSRGLCLYGAPGSGRRARGGAARPPPTACPTAPRPPRPAPAAIGFTVAAVGEATRRPVTNRRPPRPAPVESGRTVRMPREAGQCVSNLLRPWHPCAPPSTPAARGGAVRKGRAPAPVPHSSATGPVPHGTFLQRARARAARPA